MEMELAGAAVYLDMAGELSRTAAVHKLSDSWNRKRLLLPHLFLSRNFFK